MTFWKNKHILLTGGGGFLGSHIVENLVKKRGVQKSQIIIPRSKDADLRIWDNCKKATENADVVIHLAARVGGIGFNQKYPGTLFYDNIIMGAQLIESARLNQVQKFVQVGTVCSYPKYTPVPFKEENLWRVIPKKQMHPMEYRKKPSL